MRCSLVALALLVGGCSWTRFDDLKDDTPVVLLKKPDKISGFGVSLATASHGGSATLVVGGSAGLSQAASFALGGGDNPGVDAKDTSYCETQGTEKVCFLGTSLAGLETAQIVGEPKPHNGCFVVGVGKAAGATGLVTNCEDRFDFALPVPPDVNTQFIEPALANADATRTVAIASNAAGVGAVAAGAPERRLAWVTAPDAHATVQLVPPGTPDESYGEHVAVLRTGSHFIFAVAAPAVNHVWLFQSDADLTEASVVSLGCLGGVAGFGRTLASGRVNAGDDEDLVVADATNVSVFDGASLAALAATTSTECSLGSLPGGALIASFTCGSTGDVSNCAGANFGVALAVGDLDGDGDGEVLVGAPGMTSRDATRGGAVLVYNAEGSKNYELTEAQFISSAEDNDQLGSSVAAPRIGDHNIIAAGAPAGGKTALFYCSRLIPSSKRGGRCK